MHFCQSFSKFGSKRNGFCSVICYCCVLQSLRKVKIAELAKKIKLKKQVIIYILYHFIISKLWINQTKGSIFGRKLSRGPKPSRVNILRNQGFKGKEKVHWFFWKFYIHTYTNYAIFFSPFQDFLRFSIYI